MTSDSIRLGQIAVARSGDKGNHSNIGVVAFTQAGYQHLLAHLTPDRIGRFFAATGATNVQRFELPNIWGLNFVLYNSLAGGASLSLRIDTQGKLFGTALEEIQLPALPATVNITDATKQIKPSPTARG